MRVITRLNIGGPAIHVLLLTREMSRLGYRSTLVAGRCEEQDGDMSYLVRPADPVAWLPAMSRSVLPWNDLRGLWHLYRLMRKTRPLIVHTHTAKAGTLGRLAAIFAGVPVVVHTFHGNSLSNYFSPAWSAIIRTIERVLARRTDAICVISAQQARELSGTFRIAPEEKLRVIPLGLDLEPFLSLPEPRLQDGRITVGWFGRLVPIKGIPLLISVIQETLRRSDKVNFILAGDGPEGRNLERAIRDFPTGRVVWLGWQQDVLPVLSRCHLLIQTSRNEGTPVALIQGMAAGRPFISTPVGGVVDMVGGPLLNRNGGARWFANSVLSDPIPEAFASAILHFLENPCLLGNMARESRDFAGSRYRKAALIDSLDQLYRELIHRKTATEACAPAESAKVEEFSR